MKVEMPEKIAGVAALIVDPTGNILIGTERDSLQRTHKLRGMRSIPMESRAKVDNGDNEHTLNRMLYKEEVGGLHLIETRLTDRLLCVIQHRPGTWVNYYLLHTQDSFFVPGSAKDFGDLRWERPESILSSRKYTLMRNHGDQLPSFLDPLVRQAIMRVLDDLQVDKSLFLGSLKWRPGVEDSVKTYYDLRRSESTFSPPIITSTIDQIPSLVFKHIRMLR